MKQLNVSELTEQPDSTFELIADGGKVKTTRKYIIKDEVWFEHRPKLFEKDPEYKALTLRRYTAQRMEGSVRLLTLYYEAENRTDSDSNTGGTTPVDTYSLDVSLSDEPLLTHKKFETVSGEERDALVLIFQGQTTDKDGESLEDKVTSTEGVLALAKYKKGITHTREPAVVWTKKTTVSSLESLNKIGKIDSPSGPLPAVAEGRSWLFVGMTAAGSSDASTFEVETKWELSGPAGWDPDLYS